MQAFGSSYFRGKSHFEEGGTQSYLVLQSMYRYFGDTDRISEKKSKRLSKKIIEPPTTSDNILAPSLNYIVTK